MDVKKLHAEIKCLFLRIICPECSVKAYLPVVQRMVDRNHDLRFAWKAALPQLHQSGFYDKSHPMPEAGHVNMRRINTLHLDYPFAGILMLRNILRSESVVIDHEMVHAMMRPQCVSELHPKYFKNNSKRCVIPLMSFFKTVASTKGFLIH